MATIQIDDKLKEKAMDMVKKDGISYPSLKNFVDKAIREKLEKEEIQSGSD